MNNRLFASPCPKGRSPSIYEEMTELGYAIYVLYKQLVESTPLRRFIKVKPFPGGQLMCLYTKENLAALKKHKETLPPNV